jgi:uncharacterized protein
MSQSRARSTLSGRRVIWFDAASPPQVLWFSGLAEPLHDRGFELLVTARSHADTAVLAERVLPQVDAVVEGHDPSGPLARIGAITGRAARLRAFIRGRQPEQIAAVSHNSYAHILAARSLRIPVLTSMDFEGQPANHLAFRLANRVLLPEAFPSTAARRQGAPPRKVVRYPGVKEAVYLTDFEPLPRGPARPDNRAPLAVVRPEAGYATYQAGENPLLPRVIEHLVSEGAEVLLVPRGAEQRRNLAQRWSGEVEILGELVDGPELLLKADLFVGAGGTMTREAAVLGTPAYSIYWGTTPAVDLYLEELGLLRIIRQPTDVHHIDVKYKVTGSTTAIDQGTRDLVLRAIEAFLADYR